MPWPFLRRRYNLSVPANIIRTRFAPSPTGLLHIGNARTALFNWLFARGRGGDFLLRIEDTDLARSQALFESSIMEDLRWLGLEWDEGPDLGGPKGPYRQSERLGLYLDFAFRLLEKGLAYKCICTRERLEELKKEQTAKGLPPRYDNRCRALDSSDIPPDANPVVRFRVPEKTVSFADGVHGPMTFDARTFGDFVIIGSDGAASYNFAAAIDDAMMEITHIIRGDDHISNTPRQILLLEALGFRAPFFTHIPLVLGPDRAPLSKRQESVSLKSLREEGCLPEAVVNTIARLGWNPGEDFMALDGMSKAFSLERLSKSPSIFDIEKLRFHNRAAILNADPVRLANLAGLAGEGRAEVAGEVKKSASTLAELARLAAPFLEETAPSADILEALGAPESKKVVAAFRKALEGVETVSEASYNELMAKVKDETKEKGKRLFLPLRGALTGASEGIELLAVLRLLGKEKALKRLRKYEN